MPSYTLAVGSAAAPTPICRALPISAPTSLRLPAPCPLPALPPSLARCSSLEQAFSDLRNLMTKAGEMVQLAERFRTHINRKETGASL